MAESEATKILGGDLPDDTPLWRYMRLGPFVAMLTSRNLFQTKVETFEDRSEGAFGYKNATISPEVWQYLGLQARRYSDNAGDYVIAPRSSEIIRTARACTAVTCWYLHRGHEIYAMWRIYGSDDSAIAICTTLGTLRSIFRENRNVRIDLVSYAPLPPRIDDVHTLFFHKQPAYQDECELRTAQVYPSPLAERFPPVALTNEQLDALLGNIVAAPAMHPTMFDGIRSIVQEQFKSLGLDFDAARLRRSALDANYLE